MFAFALLAAPLLLANTEPAPIPEPLKAMLDAAMKSGNEAEVATDLQICPGRGSGVRRRDRARRSRPGRRTARPSARRPCAMPGVLDLWHGRAELGGYLTTGNTQDAGVSGSIDLSRETIRWRHKLNFAADYKRSAGVVSREHYLAAYEPNFKFSPRGYVYGAVQYESDRFLGYTSRYSASLGAGYSAIKQPGMKLDLEVGPAYRDTSFTDRHDRKQHRRARIDRFRLEADRGHLVQPGRLGLYAALQQHGEQHDRAQRQADRPPRRQDILCRAA